MKGIISMSIKELRRIKILEKVNSGYITIKEASKIIGVSYRHGKRLNKRYKLEGDAGLVNRNRGKRSHRKLDKKIVSQVLLLHEQKYSFFNDTHFKEFLEEQEGIKISRESVRRILRSNGKGPKKKRRQPKHRKRRKRMEIRGLMAQWDGSPHRWFGEARPPCCLMAAIDDADNALLGAFFIEAESSEAYMRLLTMILERHGIPATIYHDRHSSLKRCDDNWSLEEEFQGFQYPTHVGRVLEELGIKSIAALSAQAKGRVERLFSTLQDRLIAELKIANIKTMEEANKWLLSYYIPKHNKRFALGHNKIPATAFRKINKTQIYNTICFAYESIVGNDNCVRLGGMTIDIPPNKIRKSFVKATVLVKQHLDGLWTVWHGNNKVAHSDPTEFKEPIRSWKHKSGKSNRTAKSILQVYIASKPAPTKRGHFHVADTGTY